MNRTSLIAGGILIAALSIATALFVRSAPPDSSAPIPSAADIVQQPPSGLEPRAQEQNGLAVSVVPLSDLSEGAVWEFLVAMDRHDGSADDDLSSSAVMYDGSGTRYRPLRWQGDPPGGHHREGTLLFAPVAGPGSIRLELSLAAGQYVFTWDI